MLTTRYRRLVKAIKRLYYTVWLLCARLPPAAVQSPESFVDCVVQICNSPLPAGMRLSGKAHVPRFIKMVQSGFLLLNHTGRVNFKYVVGYILDKYRSLVLNERVEFYEQPMIRRLARQKEFGSHVIVKNEQQ